MLTAYPVAAPTSEPISLPLYSPTKPYQNFTNHVRVHAMLVTVSTDVMTVLTLQRLYTIPREK